MGYLGVDVELTCNEKKVVANAVEQNRNKDEGGLRAARCRDTLPKAEIAGSPRQDSKEDRLLITQPFQHQRQKEQEDDIRYLGE